MLILLETRNRILEEAISSAISADKKPSVDIKICDFDGAQYWLRSIKASAEGSYDILLLSLSLPTYHHLTALPIDRVLKDTYGDLVVDPEPGSDVCLRMDLGNIAPSHTSDLVQAVSRLREVVAGSPFSIYFTSLSQNMQLKQQPFKFALHHDCIAYLLPKHDRVTCAFALTVKERSDAVISSVFLAEFAEARRKVPSGPMVQFSTTPPKEVLDAFPADTSLCNVGYMMFAILPNHVDSPAKIDAASTIFSGFRTYVQYHIKCSKAYFHSRMRAKVVSLLKVLNRAKVDHFDDGKEKKKKTFSGRTFEQKT
uniref:Arp2/3 complex 34 kDa subunit n=1 Tax=Spongospora subterranea TaxID=70186 RepID=A0A0H5RLR2_9EUKA|eukprot:CRZ09669.1 hypothetical protein [Spongospora subterranea]